jgi:hypothetical protein
MIKKKHGQIFMRVSDPFDDSAKARLVNMGVLNKDGAVCREAMSAFAGVFTGLFFDDLCDYFNSPGDLREIFRKFTELHRRDDYQHMYLLISIQYDYIRRPLPDPLWWLAGNTAAVREFMPLFMKRYSRLMSDAGFLPPREGGDS